MTREERAWKKLCGGKPLPRPKSFVPTPDDDPHPERRTDPRYQMHPWLKGSRGLAGFRSAGLLNEAKLQAHFDKLSAPSVMGASHGAL